MAPYEVTPGTTSPTGDLMVEGLGGLFAGVRRRLGPGATLVVGRSRSCHLSLRRTSAFSHHPAPDRLLLSPEFNRISRIHCEIEHRADGSVEVRDFSRNGTIVNGERVGRSRVLRLDGRRIVLELVDGTWGKLLIAEGGGADTGEDSGDTGPEAEAETGSGDETSELPRSS